MIRKSLNPRSRGHHPKLSHVQGFSLIEVMMSVVLIAIGLTLALPSYRDMVEKRQITNGAEQLASFINTAQGVAMKTNQVVTVSYSKTAENDWCVGAVSGTTPCDCTVTNTAAADYCMIATQPIVDIPASDRPDQPYVLNASQTGNLELMHSMEGDGAYKFNPVRGLFQKLDDSLGSLTVEMRSPSEDFRLNLVVSSTGKVLLCSDDSEHGVPGYAVCPPGDAEEAEES